MVEISQTELAWAAGFFDGEGHTGLTQEQNPGKKRYTLLDVPQSYDPYVLNRFKAAVLGVGVIYGPTTTTHGLRWNYKTTNWPDTQFVIALLWRYLSPVKRAQASIVLSHMRDQNQLTKRSKYRIQCKHGHPWVEENILLDSNNGYPSCRYCRYISRRVSEGRTVAPFEVWLNNRRTTLVKKELPTHSH